MLARALKVAALAVAAAVPLRQVDNVLAALEEASTTVTSQGAICVMSIDGYEWPTQPSDINDKRTFCTTKGPDGDDYRCEPGHPGEFSLKPYVVPDLIWPLVQKGTWNDDVEGHWTEAIKAALTDDECHAMVGNAGFFAFFTDRVNTVIAKLIDPESPEYCSECTPKPWLGSALSMAPVLVGNAFRWKWSNGSYVLGEDEDIHILTSEGHDLEKPSLVKLMADVKLSTPKAEENALKRTAKVLSLANMHYTTNPSPDALIFKIDDYIEYILTTPELAKRCDAKKFSDKWSAVKNNPAALAWLFNQTFGEEEIRNFVENDEDVSIDCGLSLVVAKKANRFAVTGLEKIPYCGQPIALDASAYNAKLAAPLIVDAFAKDGAAHEAEHKRKLKYFLVECSEAQIWGNSLRGAFKMGGWDITTVATCMVYTNRMGYQPAGMSRADFAQKIKQGVALFEHEGFKQCMLDRLHPDKFTTKWGVQQNGSFPYYDTLTDAQLESFICDGGRPAGAPPIARKVEEYCTSPRNFTSSCTALKPGGIKSCSCAYWPQYRIDYYKATGKDGTCGEPCPDGKYPYATCPGGGQCGGEHAECGLNGHTCPVDVVVDMPRVEGVTAEYGHMASSSSCSVP